MMASTIKMIEHKLNHPDGIDIYGISDLHDGSEQFCEKEFIKVRNEILERPNRYVVLGGDLVDNGIINSKTSMYEETSAPMKQIRHVIELLKPLAPRTLTIVPGNHERRSINAVNIDPAELIAERLGILDLYRPNCAYLKIDLGRPLSHDKTAPRYCVYVHHGSSGGQTAGAGLSAADRYACISGADLIILGHSHKPGLAPASRFICDMAHGVVVQRDYRIMICTAWLSYGGYPADKGYRPLPIALTTAHLGGSEYSVKVSV